MCIYVCVCKSINLCMHMCHSQDMDLISIFGDGHQSIIIGIYMILYAHPCWIPKRHEPDTTRNE